MRTGVRMGLDFGSRRIGVARSDRDGILATPMVALDAETDWIAKLHELLDDTEAIELVVGLPVSLRGAEEIAAQQVRLRIAELRSAFPELPIRVVDERLTSATANRRLQEGGHSTRSARTRVDAVAAAEILEFALEYERRTGTPAGESA